MTPRYLNFEWYTICPRLNFAFFGDNSDICSLYDFN